MYGDPFLPGYEQVYNIFLGSYDWAEFRVFKQGERFFYATDSGCSCTCFEDQVTETNLIELPTLNAASDAVKEFLESEGSGYDGKIIDKYFDAVEKFRDLGLR